MNVRTDWWSRRAIGLHAALLVTLPTCAALGYWQASRALSGNTLSWVYTVEWPFFAAYGTYMWWRLLHEDPGAARRAARAGSLQGGSSSDGAPGVGGEVVVNLPAGFDPYDDETDPELAAYNRYLAGLHAADRDGRG